MSFKRPITIKRKLITAQILINVILRTASINARY